MNKNLGRASSQAPKLKEADGQIQEQTPHTVFHLAASFSFCLLGVFSGLWVFFYMLFILTPLTLIAICVFLAPVVAGWILRGLVVGWISIFSLLATGSRSWERYTRSRIDAGFARVRAKLPWKATNVELLFDSKVTEVIMEVSFVPSERLFSKAGQEWRLFADPHRQW